MIEFTLKVLQKEKNISYSCYRNIGLFPLLDSATHVRIQKKASGTSSSPEASIKTAATYSPTVTQYHRRDKA